MNTLPKKIVYDIANFLDEKDIINFCETNKRLYSIGNELYFMNKYFNRFKNVVSINFLLIKSIITGCGDLYKGQEKKLSNICKFVTPRGRYIYVIDINYNLYIIDNGQSINKSIIDKFFQTNTKFQSKNIIKIAENIKDIQTNNFKSLIFDRRVLKPGGCLVISETDQEASDDAVRQFIRRFKVWFIPGGLLFWGLRNVVYGQSFSETTLADAVRDAGFHHIECQRIPACPYIIVKAQK